MRWWFALAVVMLLGVTETASADDNVRQREAFAVYCVSVLDTAMVRSRAAEPPECFRSEDKTACEDRKLSDKQRASDEA